MRECGDIRLDFLELLSGGLGQADQATVLEHVAACPACEAELRGLREAWDMLPARIETVPPTAVRKSVFAYARHAVAPGGILVALWTAVREVVAPVGLGTVAALVIILLMHFRGAIAPLGRAGLATLSLSLAAALVLVAGGILRSSTPQAARAALLGAAGALGGYVALSFALPLPATFEICRLALFRGAAMSMSQMCVVYLVIAAAYAGIPLGVAAYVWWGGGVPVWAAGLAKAMLFTMLAAPVLVLQAGVEQAMVTGTVALGLVLGSLVVGAAGTWAGTYRLVGSRV